MLGSKNPKVLHGCGWCPTVEGRVAQVPLDPTRPHPWTEPRSWFLVPRGAPPTPPAPLNLLLTDAAQEIVPVLSPLSKGLVFICPAACPSPVFLYHICIRTPILVGPHPYCPLTVNLWRNTNTRAGVSCPIPFSKDGPNRHRQNPQCHTRADLSRHPLSLPLSSHPAPGCPLSEWSQRL